ncbi:MAG: DUF523 and DUF1722 domain-containing protein [Candidatus Marinimicrobia bacterium]|nr:DUF523 and DUF1722 domain-containing protein [Candidatus Neomarinimicrobiota bacterium]
MKPRIVVSKCLGFDQCRYNGQTIPDKFIEKLTEFAEIITVCPEVEIGLGIPRHPVRLGKKGEKTYLIQPATDLDVTHKMETFTSTFLSSLEDIDGFIMKNRSPSCGINDVKIYHSLNKLSASTRGTGIFGGSIQDFFPFAAMEDEGRLKNLSIREYFLTRLYVNLRFRSVKKSGNMKSLVKFQTEHKYLFMAHNQEAYRTGGQIVANHEKDTFEKVIKKYEENMSRIMKKPAKIQATINAIHHIFGGFSKNLSKDEKVFFLNTVEEYRDERITLTTIIHLLKSYAVRFESQFVKDQIFLNPFPADLVSSANSGKKSM